MATRLSNSKEKGYYKRLNSDFAENDYGETYMRDTDLVIGEDDVYEVERLIKKRDIKGVVHFLVLRKNYSKEASWIPESDYADSN
uniref:Chromo domain-containing protein n=1 Tax=Amphimedon queenslandica TaxID=400682 RepID=A0A1X7V7D4_AMPQE